MHSLPDCGFDGYPIFYGSVLFRNECKTECISVSSEEKKAAFSSRVREFLEDDDMTDDDERRGLNSFAEKLGIPACDMEQLISSNTQNHKENI